MLSLIWILCKNFKQLRNIIWRWAEIDLKRIAKSFCLYNAFKSKWSVSNHTPKVKFKVVYLGIIHHIIQTWREVQTPDVTRDERIELCYKMLFWIERVWQMLTTGQLWNKKLFLTNSDKTRKLPISVGCRQFGAGALVPIRVLPVSRVLSEGEIIQTVFGQIRHLRRGLINTIASPVIESNEKCRI